MSVPTTIPTTIQLRPSRFFGLIAGAAALAAVVTWALLVFAVDTGSEGARESISTSAYVEGIVASTPEQLAAAFGTPQVDGLSFLNPTERAYVQGILNSTPNERAAAFGNGLGSLSPYVQGIMESTPQELAAAFGNGEVAGLSPTERQYVQGIMELTPEQLAAAHGR